jgi:hypothetical protein
VGVVREGAGGRGGEMTQTTYAHMNKMKIKKKNKQIRVIETLLKSKFIDTSPGPKLKGYQLGLLC